MKLTFLFVHAEQRANLRPMAERFAVHVYYGVLMSEQTKTRRQMLEEFVAKKPDDAFSRYGLALSLIHI